MNTDSPIILRNEAQTLSYGEQLAKQLKPGQLIYLRGNLGAGKTTLVRGILHGLGYQNKVKSPTFTLVEPYEFAAFNLYHFDLYRLEDSHELEALGFRDYVNPNSICLIEWPEKAVDFLPAADLDIHLEINANQRLLKIC